MRGKTFHNYMVKKTKLLLISLGWCVFLEYCICRKGITNFVDIFATMDGFKLLFEIETSARHITDNCYKAQAIDVPLCVIVPTSKVYEAAIKKICHANIKPAGRAIRIFKLNQLQQGLTGYLSLIIVANSDMDK